MLEAAGLEGMLGAGAAGLGAGSSGGSKKPLWAGAGAPDGPAFTALSSASASLITLPLFFFVAIFAPVNSLIIFYSIY
jgi:hypothetical protein